MNRICQKRAMLIAVTWVWLYLGGFITALLITYVNGRPLTYSNMHDILYEKPYLVSYIQAVSVGLPPLISLACVENLSFYGLRKEGIIKSSALAVTPAAILLISRIIRGSIPHTSFNLQFPHNIIYAALSVLAYGPLEAFFVIWLIANTDSILGERGRILSRGLLITALLFGLSHIILSPKAGLLNAASVAIVFLILGLIFNYTGNSTGPMIAWTLVNGQVTYMLVGCLA